MIDIKFIKDLSKTAPECARAINVIIGTIPFLFALYLFGNGKISEQVLMMLIYIISYVYFDKKIRDDRKKTQ